MRSAAAAEILHCDVAALSCATKLLCNKVHDDTAVRTQCAARLYQQHCIREDGGDE